jgi:hypothetical protein
MSAFMVTDDTINRVVSWLAHEVTKSNWFKETIENKLKIDTTQPHWEETLGRAMFRLNIAGVNERYGKREARNFRDLHYRYSPTFGTKIQVLKSLECWLYQCMEGDVVKRTLFKFFDTVIEHRLLASIVHELPEYIRAKWE